MHQYWIHKEALSINKRYLKVRKVEESVNTNKLVVTTSERTRMQLGFRKGTEISRTHHVINT